MKIVVCITGASGVIYGLRLIENLIKRSFDINLVISKNGFKVIEQELNVSADESDFFPRLISNYSPDALNYYPDEEIGAPFASGSTFYDACVIVPCSMGTLGRIAAGTSDSLITRTSDVFLKEKRKLMLLIRETPLNIIHLENMKKVANAGAVIMPACPAFYTHPKTVDEMINFVVGRILNHLQIFDHKLYKPWSDE